MSRIRQKDALPKLLARLAGQTAQMLNIRAAGSKVGLTADTAENYTRLLEDVYLIHRLPAWGKTLRARAVATPKLHVVDSGLASRLMRISPATLARRDATSLQQFGHLLETFVVFEVLKQASWTDRRGAQPVLDRGDLGPHRHPQLRGMIRTCGWPSAG